jgi:hypothetical protein
VMIVNVEERAEPRPVTVLQGDSAHVWVQGLEKGERVIVHSSRLILAGMEVSVNAPDLAIGAF